MKRCFKCERGLPLTEFYAHPRMTDGCLGKCKECTKRDMRAQYRRKRNDPKWLEAERARGREKAARLYRSPFQWTAPSASAEEKRKASNAVNNAVRDGRIHKPTACEDCGASGKRIHGHHEDYSKPLQVRWLCTTCHRRRHFVARSA